VSRTNQILAGLLVAQLLLAAFTWSGTSHESEAAGGSENLLSVSTDDVTGLSITAQASDDEGAAQVIEVKRDGADWVLPNADGYPADKKKIEDIIAKLVEAKVKEPIATKRTNHAALNVGDTVYTKKVTVRAGEKTMELIIGSAKGSSMHVRRAGEDAVYLARGVSAWKISDRIESYIANEYIKIDDPTEVRVQNAFGPLDLQKQEDGTWLIAQLPPGTPVDDSRVRSFVSAARSVRLARPVGKTVKPEYGLGEAARARVVIKSAENLVSYSVGAFDGDEVYVKDDANDFVVKVRKYAVDSLIGQTPDKFIKQTVTPQK
jgi:hypothetical protein